jgi:hypothetical protein
VVPILTLEGDPYALAIAVVGGLGALSLAAHIYTRWFMSLGARFSVVYGLVLTLVSVFGIWVVGSYRIVPTSLTSVGLSLAVGLVAGIAATLSDRSILRALGRRQARMRSRGARTRPQPPRLRDLRSRPGTQLGRERRQLGLQRVQTKREPSFDISRDGLLTLASVGALEELEFRGALLGACFLLPWPALRVAALAATVAAFALTHVWYGWPHVLAKFPLGLLALIAAIAVGNVLAAIVAHVFFNAAVWRELRDRASIGVSNRPLLGWLGPSPTP